MWHCTRQLAVAFAVLVISWPTSVAFADGDPASDVLALAPLYLPQDANVPEDQKALLAALLGAVRRTGYQLRVALIASPADLGSVTALWRRPGAYARFLGQELSLLYRGLLLVVMPNGYGLSALAGVGSREMGAVGELPAPGARLGSGALTAIQRLLAVSGKAIRLPPLVAPRRSGGGDSASWLVLAIGGALIALAWTASLRAQPLGASRAGGTPPTSRAP